MPWPSDATDALAAIDVSLSEAERTLLERFEAMVLDRGRSTNLVSHRDSGRLFDRHVFDSLAGVGMLDWHDVDVVDVGSGAGFPGIPLAIVCPEARFTLVERTRKRVSFIEHAIGELGLSNALAVWSDVRDIGADRADIVTVRAVAATAEALKIVGRALKSSGKVLLWQSADQHEREPTPSGWTADWRDTKSRDDIARGIRIVTRG
jgi:16S rRNA (guanine527-N7)-methyltransferase